MKTYHISLLALSLLALDGCGGGNNTPQGPQVSEPRSFQNLQFQVETDRAIYRPGEEMKMTFRVTNAGNGPVTLSYEGDLHRFQITRIEDTRQTLTFPPFVVISHPLPTQTITPGQTLTFQRNWNLAVVDKPVPGGSYTVKAYLSGRIQGVPEETQTSQALSSNPVHVQLRTPCPQDHLGMVPGVVGVQISPADSTDKELIAFIEQIGVITRQWENYNGNISLEISLKTDACIVDALAYLQANPRIRSAEPRIYPVP